MDFFDTLSARQSVRAYQPKDIDEKDLQRVLEAVRTAPTAGNFQAYEVYVVRGERVRELVGATFNQTFLAEAPVVLIFCSIPERCQYDDKEFWAMQDTCVAATIAHLAVAALGLATCWIGAFIPAKVAATVGIPDGQIPVAILPIGYAAEIPERTSRRELKEFVHEIK